ncbi:CesT family type III secretion system chaperone [Paludibacterium yongneupense]|uniref:CesT family type III secretion system chaperone n=1 Tax=Paludibacterium yongneupense TaxID=400061 RepID=UPI0004230E7D|nr:CesT family type III secretion system chaperone [Paludibacterium yongneupense]
MSLFDDLLLRLHLRSGFAFDTCEETMVSLRCGDGLRVYLAAYQDRWLVLYHELDGDCGPVTPDNLFGRHWPAHVLSPVDGIWILWSQQPLAGLSEHALECWVSDFAASVARYRSPAAATEKARGGWF